MPGETASPEQNLS